MQKKKNEITASCGLKLEGLIASDNYRNMIIPCGSFNKTPPILLINEDIFTFDFEKNMEYEIKDEIVDGDTATVTVEIEVKDYSKTLKDAETYLNEHKEEFNNDKNEYDESLFTSYRLEQLKKSTDKVKYTLNIYLTKVDNEWKMDDLSETDRMKINGMYEY